MLKEKCEISQTNLATQFINDAKYFEACLLCSIKVEQKNLPCLDCVNLIGYDCINDLAIYIILNFYVII